MKLVGLSRQLAITMAAIAFTAVALVILTSFGFYYILLKYWPEQYQEHWFPNLAEAIWLLLTTLAGVSLAVFVAGRVAKRILNPLNAVALAIRQVAHGDLSARAVIEDRSMREAAALVDDFNQLAQQLQRATEERAFWNAAIAHELRTPVTILRGRIQGLADGVFQPDETQFRRLLLQIEGLARLIEDLRAVSLADSGHLSLQWQHVCLADDIQETSEALRDTFAQRGQHLMLDLQVARADCDPMRIRQALLALLDNARRYAVPGSIMVRSRQSDGEIEISVEDEGPGLPAQFMPHAFEAFRRASSKGDDQDRGSGLGLAVVAAIAQAHGGRASCEPGSAGGTRFSMRWPVPATRRALSDEGERMPGTQPEPSSRPSQ